MHLRIYKTLQASKLLTWPRLSGISARPRLPWRNFEQAPQKLAEWLTYRVQSGKSGDGASVCDGAAMIFESGLGAS